MKGYILITCAVLSLFWCSGDVFPLAYGWFIEVLLYIIFMYFTILNVLG